MNIIEISANIDEKMIEFPCSVTISFSSGKEGLFDVEMTFGALKEINYRVVPSIKCEKNCYSLLGDLKESKFWIKIITSELPFKESIEIDNGNIEFNFY